MITTKIEKPITKGQTAKYPWLGVDIFPSGDPIYVLFCDKGCGTCLINSSHPSKVGMYSENWGSEYFKPADANISFVNS